MLASLLLAGSVVLGGLGAGVAASTVSAAAPVGSVSTVEDVPDSRPDTSARRRAARSVSSRWAVGRGVDPSSGPAVLVERLLVRLLRLAPPTWRGPPVLLI